MQRSDEERSPPGCPGRRPPGTALAATRLVAPPSARGNRANHELTGFGDSTEFRPGKPRSRRRQPCVAVFSRP